MTDLLNTVADNPVTAVGLGLAVVAALVLLFGRETAWRAVVAVWNRLTGNTNVLLALVLAPALAACAAFPRTTAAFNERGVGAAIDTLLSEAQARVVAVCDFVDRPQVATVVDLAADTTGLDAAVADFREDREKWCAELGGSLIFDVQNRPAE